MRLARSSIAVALLAGCRESVTGLYSPDRSPPSGLAVTLGVTPSHGVAQPSPTVEVANDSVIVAAVLSSSGCVDHTVLAGQESGALVVTILKQPNGRPCLLGMFRATFRAAVRNAPRGRYDVVLRQRFEAPPQAPQELVVARRAVTLR